MIENIRKYTGLMAVVFVLLAIGFLFTMNDIGGNQGPGIGNSKTVLSAHGRSLDQQEYSRMGGRTLELASAAGLNNYVNLLLAPDINALQQSMQFSARFSANYYNVSKNDLGAQEVDRFVANRIIIQKAFADMGLYASEEEVSEQIKKLPSFSSEGKFDAAAYSQFIENGIGNIGMTEKDLREVVREDICLQKLTQIIGGGTPETEASVRSQFQAAVQAVTFSRVSFELNDFIKKEAPTEEEIKAYWESHQDAYKSDETRRINYVIIDVPTQVETPTVALAEDASDEEKAAKKMADQAAAAKKAEKLAADVKVLKREMNEISQIFYDRIDEKQPLDFETVISERGKTVVKTALFPQSGLPAELAQYATLRGSVNQSASLVDVIFELNNSEDPYDLISDPLPVGKNGWIIFTLEEIVTPTLLSYADAKEKARTDFIAENALKQVKEAAQDAHKQITEAVKAGQTFNTVAKEKGFQSISVGPFSATSAPPADEPSYRELHQTASGLNPGEVSEVIDEPNRSFFIHLDKRELEEAEENEARIQTALAGSGDIISLHTFINWINHQYLVAEVKARPTSN